MASQLKSTSRWGSLLQQAVAGVESRLDNILADDDGSSASGGKQSASSVNQSEKRETVPVKPSVRTSGELSRQSSTNRKQDRLQERLAKAVVNRNSPKSTASSAVPSRNGSPTRVLSSPRSSLDIRIEELSLNQNSEPINESKGSRGGRSSDLNSNRLENGSSSRELKDAPQRRSSVSKYMEEITPYSLPEDLSISTPFAQDTGNTESPNASQAENEMSLEQMSSEHESTGTKRQEESNLYLEHIDALQAKLEYLTREAAEFARNIAGELDAGSSLQRLALKDEKIALLLDEGQKLSQIEMKHLATIKKLRIKSIEEEKRLSQAKRDIMEGDRTKKLLHEKLAQAEIMHREDSERLKHLEKKDRELEQVESELTLKTAQIVELQSQIVRYKNSGIEEVIKYKDLLDAEKKIASTLRNDLMNAKVERELEDDRHRAQCRDIKGQADRDKERARVTELDLKGELQVMESRFETYRARAEEVSSEGAGDVQAKLIRQIETLQSSYSVASENWRGIESSLLARITGLEKERDDLAKKESDIRRRARDASSKCRQMESQQEETVQRLRELERNLAQEVQTSSNLKSALLRNKADADRAQSDFRAASQIWEARLERLEADRQDNTMETLSVHLGGQSPVVRPTTDRVSPRGRRPQVASGLGLTGASLPVHDKPLSRRTSGQPLYGFMPSRQDSTTSITQISSIDSVPETPFNAESQDDMFDGVVTPATPEKTINDMFSVSTAAASPSVQLVERMSAAVRRLESEKASAKEELDRLASQRDEAREQVVSLMREVEDKRAMDAKVLSLQAEAEEVKRKLDTTLEMLGEKSELVEELRADIVDMKEIYRSTLENTVK